MECPIEKENSPENNLASDRPISPEKKIPEENKPEEKPPEQQPLEVTPEKQNSEEAKIEKRNARRRSSIGLSILNSLMAPGTEDIPSPVDLKPRPKRAVQVKYEQKKPVVPVIKRAKPIRYSQAAQKVINKYRKSRSIGENSTPPIDKSSKLKFHNICSIRVITPRPSYDPLNLALPDDDQVAANRERLSTVKLVLTPTSQTMIDSIRDSDVVQFNAEMVFGDGDLFATTSSSCENVVESSVETAESSVSSEKDLESQDVRKKSSRRKSLIKGSASPLKSPAKVEKPRNTDYEDEVIESKPTRKSRRSVRPNSDTIEKPENSDDGELQEREKNSKKKRVLVPEQEKIEPNPKRSRRKSGYLIQESVETVTEKTEGNFEKKNVTMLSFFTPKSSKKKEEDSRKAIENARKAEEKARKAEENARKTEEEARKAEEKARKAEEDAKKERKKARRSSAYFGTADRRKNTVKEVSEEPDIVVISECETIASSKSSNKVDLEVIAETTVIATTSSSSSSSLKSKETVTTISTSSTSEASIFSKPPKKEISGMKLNEASTSAPKPSSSAPKLFSLFSPKPKPKLDLNSSQDPISLSDSPVVPKIKEIPKKSIGVKRKEHWGDLHPESYEYMLKMPSQPSVFDKDTTYTIDEKLFNSRSFDESILAVDSVDSELRPIESKVPNLLFPRKSTENLTIEKLSVPDGACTTTIYPPDMKSLVEGSETEDQINRWLNRWKRRVRKDLERELQKEKEKKNGGSKRGRKKRDREEEDSDYEEEGYDDDLENPLVLIGPTGVGKTALIRALAKEANMRIISIGPETDRSGAEIKKKLQESIRSHRVDQQPTRFETTFFKTISSQKEPTPRKQPKDFIQSLIVFEHVDVFFDTADRFGVNGLLEIVNESAVPIIFTCQNDWPRRTAQTELKRPYLEVRLGRNDCNIQKYVQRVVYSCRNVIIDDSTIRQLSESVDHDLQGLLRQAHLYSLAPTKPFPLTSRQLVSSGFDKDWERPGGSSSKTHERLEHLMEEYFDVIPDGFSVISHPEIRRIWDDERRELAVKETRYSENLQSIYEALNGRHSRKELILDVNPFLVQIDRIEREKISKNRRHFHHFKEPSDIPVDGHTLCDFIGAWRINRH
ncbi:hypothetical protein GCK72_006581 [Caenorhabditis remanei]|uniref:AAA+ ATPase domain-containing protein n=1 Tax=Caenorhabditis remanei TaxID=31234 RepID=A0A6A5HJQ6_CAERE|nr:hypothetical protein GCK72_006581 [Caenorhabditis remanei]KAF1766623.1 hypothetical protein GCK72_006581 [Caenorhabditis remanei]